MNIYIASDHGGFNDKSFLIENLKNESTKLIDMGPFNLDPTDDYPDYAFKLAEKVSNDQGSLGILICRSGNGMFIAANKVKGAYASLCFSEKHAEMARKDDNSNILCLDADYQENEQILQIVKAFLNSAFEGMESRHGRRFAKIQDYENNH